MKERPPRGIHAHVVRTLGVRIVKGELVPGERIDLDAFLEDESISRTVLREALRTLTGKGLLRAQPKLGTFVADRKQWHLLDDDVMLWRASGRPDRVLIRDLGELREIFEPSAAALAASHRSDVEVGELEAAIETMKRGAESRDIAAIADADVRFHRAVLAGSGNELLGRFEMMLEPALHARNALTLTANMTSSFVDQHVAVARAIVASDVAAAYDAMAILVRGAKADALAAERAVEVHTSKAGHEASEDRGDL